MTVEAGPWRSRRVVRQWTAVDATNQTAAAVWFVVRPWPWRSLWSIARLPLSVSGRGWLLLRTVVMALRLRAIG